MSLNLGMSKAYDRVEWSFIKSMIEVVGFNQNFIHMIMYCVSLVSFSVLINGDPKGPVLPSRWLRQGHPLSPYLFLICTNGLTTLLKEARLRREISSLKICKVGPNIIHLLFADDSVLFYKAEVGENRRVQAVLEKYEVVSSERINKEKTTMVFSGNVSREVREEIKMLWGNSEIQQYERYLGLPPIVGRSRH